MSRSPAGSGCGPRRRRQSSCRRAPRPEPWRPTARRSGGFGGDVRGSSHLTAGRVPMYIATRFCCQPHVFVLRGDEMAHRLWRLIRLVAAGTALVVLGAALFGMSAVARRSPSSHPAPRARPVNDRLYAQGRRVFRFDTFGDQAFWGGQLQLHKAIEGRKLGGVGPGVSPKTALAVGLKVDSGALPASLITALKHGKVNLNS